MSSDEAVDLELLQLLFHWFELGVVRTHKDVRDVAKRMLRMRSYGIGSRLYWKSAK